MISSCIIHSFIHSFHTPTAAMMVLVHTRAAWRRHKVLTHMKKTAGTRKRYKNGRDYCLSFRLRRLLPALVGYLAAPGVRKVSRGTD